MNNQPLQFENFIPVPDPNRATLAVNTAKKQQDDPKRIYGVPFKPGESGNPNGRPKGSRNFTTKVRDALEKMADGKTYTYEEALIKTILKRAIVDGNDRMLRLIWNYLDGMPAQEHKVEADVTYNIINYKGWNEPKD